MKSLSDEQTCMCTVNECDLMVYVYVGVATILED